MSLKENFNEFSSQKYYQQGAIFNVVELEKYIKALKLDYVQSIELFFKNYNFSKIGGFIMSQNLVNMKFGEEETIFSLINKREYNDQFFLGIYLEKVDQLDNIIKIFEKNNAKLSVVYQSNIILIEDYENKKLFDILLDNIRIIQGKNLIPFVEINVDGKSVESFKGDYSYKIESILSKFVYKVNGNKQIFLEHLFIITNIHEIFLSLSTKSSNRELDSSFKLIRTINRTIPPCVDTIGLKSNCHLKQFLSICKIQYEMKYFDKLKAHNYWIIIGSGQFVNIVQRLLNIQRNQVDKVNKEIDQALIFEEFTHMCTIVEDLNLGLEVDFSTVLEFNLQEVKIQTNNNQALSAK